MRVTIPLASILPPVLLLAALAGCTASPPPEPAPAPQPAPATLSAADIERANQPQIDPRWLSDTIAYGTATLENGAPAAGADVYVAIADGIPGNPGYCDDPRGLHGLVRTSADAEGRWRTPIPRAERGRPGCLFILAEVRDTTAPVHDRVLAVGAIGVDVDSVPVHVPLRIVPPPDADPPWPTDPRADWQWPRVAEHIPGWAGWINTSPCSAIVSLRDTTQQAIARAYVQEELAARRHPGDAPCPGFDITIQKVDHGWADLGRWSSRAGLLFQFWGVEMFDMDEVANRVVYRFREPRGARAARRALASLRVPPEAIEILERLDDEYTPDFGPEAPVLGRLLGWGTSTESAVWSGDGREILYLAEDTAGDLVRATDVVAREVRDVVRIAPHDGLGADRLRRASDGMLYTDAEVPQGTGIVRLRPGTGAPPELLLRTQISRFEMDSAGRRFVARWQHTTEDGHDEEALVLYDARTGQRRTLMGEPSPWHAWWMEPGGRAVAYAAENYDTPANGGVWMYDVASGRRRQLWRGSMDEPAERVSTMRWVNGAPRLLLVRRPAGADSTEMVELNPATGARTRLGSFPALHGEWPASVGAWSPDGRRAAVWVSVAFENSGFGTVRDHVRLYLWEAGQEPRMIAEFMEYVQEGRSWEAAFSPDGTRLMYPAGGRIYVHDLQ